MIDAMDRAAAVGSIEMRLRRMSYKPLRPARVLARESHADCTTPIFDLIYLAANFGAAVVAAVTFNLINPAEHATK